MDKRTLLTAAMCFAALMLWGWIGPKVMPPPPNKPAVQKTVDTSDPSINAQMPAIEQGSNNSPPAQQAANPAQGTQNAGTQKETAAPEQNQAPEQKIAVQNKTLKNKYLEVSLTNIGASITDARLVDKYHETVKGEQPLRLLTLFDAKQRTLGMQVGDTNLANRYFEVVGQTDNSVTYQTTLPSGLRVTKTVTLPADRYDLQVTVKLENASSNTVQTSYTLTSAAGIIPDIPAWEKNKSGLQDWKSSNIEGDVGKVVGENVKVDRFSPGKVQDATQTVNDSPVAWAGIKNRYFSAVLKPIDGTTVTSGQVSHVASNNVAASLQSKLFELKPNQSATDKYMLFVGPNDKDLLSDAAYSSFAGIHKTPWPAPITSILKGILDSFHSITGNYGLAIILLTILVRIALHPLTRKSQKSMFEMQKLGPKMKELKAKYKDDKQKMQQESMKLYREHGVNPMGGCLPMLLQLPIFIGLFRTLQSSIELRHASFMLWMKDLSQPDALAMLPKSVPFFGGGPLNVLPILMIVTMFLQQKFTPKPSADPQQEQTQKMMMYMMPAMFGILFYGMPSGLVLYFMTSTGLGVLESWWIRRHLAKQAELPAKPKKRTQETWLERAAKAKAARGRKIK